MLLKGGVYISSYLFLFFVVQIIYFIFTIFMRANDNASMIPYMLHFFASIMAFILYIELIYVDPG